MTKPSKAELREMASDILASDCVSGSYPGCPRINLVRIAGVLRALGNEQDEPEPPKVETLREAAERMKRDRHSSYSDNQADLCAIVLRRHLRLLKLFIELLQRSSSSMPDMRERLQQEYREVLQMLAESGE